MITVSGKLIMPDGNNAPTLGDIAQGLSRAPRFAGHLVRNWSVAEHSLACARTTDDNALKLHLLLHDAHETVTGDIPATWKSQGIKNQQHDIDSLIYRELGLYVPSPSEHQEIKRIDWEIQVAEAFLMGSKTLFDWYETNTTKTAEHAVESVMRTYAADRSSETVMADYFSATSRLLLLQHA